MNIFEYLSGEEIKEDLEPCTRRSINTPDNVSEEEYFTKDEAVIAGFYKVATQHNKEVDALYCKYEEACQDADDIDNVSDLVTEVSTEDMNPLKAEFLNAHICGLQSSMALRRVDINLNKYSPEEFENNVDYSVKQQLADQSAEDIKAKVIDAAKKAIEIFSNVVKKIMEMVTRMLANTEKLKAGAEAALAKLNTTYTVPEGTMNAPTGLQVSGKLDIAKAVSSYAACVNEVIKLSNYSNKETADIIHSATDSKDLSKLYMGFTDGSKAEGAKIIAHLGGNVDVGVGNGVLYSLNIPNEKQSLKPLSKSEMTTVLNAVIKDYDAIKKIGDQTKHITDELEKNIKIISSKIKNNSSTDGEKSTNIDLLTTRVLTSLNAKSGIKVLSRMGTLSYITCMDAIKVCEWSMSGKEAKAEK